MRPPSDEDIENYDEIMWSFIDMLQALLDWRKIIDLQSNGETVFRVTMSFPGLLGPSQEPDIQVVRSWDELPPLPEKHPPGYWRGVWEASPAEQQQPAEEAPPEPAEPGYWPVPPPNPAKRPSYPPPEDLCRLKPQPLPSMPSIEDLLRTGDTVLQSMAAIGSGTVGPLFDWKATAASFDAMNQFFGMVPAKVAARSEDASASGWPNARKANGAPTMAPGDITGMSGLYRTPMSSDDLTKEVVKEVAADLRGFGKGLVNGVPRAVFTAVDGFVGAGAVVGDLTGYALGLPFDGFAGTRRVAETLTEHNDGTILPVAPDEEAGDFVGEFFSPGAAKKVVELTRDLAKPAEEFLWRVEQSIHPLPEPVPGLNPALTPARPFLDPAGKPIPTFKANRSFRFDRALGTAGSDLEATTQDLVKQEPGYIGSFDSKAADNSGTGIDHAYAKLVNGEPKLFVIEDKSRKSIDALTALGGGRSGVAQLKRNARILEEAIEKSDIPGEYKRALIEQAKKRTFAVELHISDGSRIPRARFDSLADMGLTLDRILVFPEY